MKKILAILAVATMFVASSFGALIFSDTFETGGTIREARRKVQKAIDKLG